ncbi:response regulator [Ramlibacter alkalitolerans]|jgi:two-component system invasion response regulator UvrY|uniref:Response regulator transcription factor n=1 Tax=Ramlibacter alkalitolerans TaxID=2039631 RepID=A0ABS1JW45_9BURK|nr:response regulator transcription factor [Ramlibacter alkalitolerans]MBL0428540.1 response regulator transcription factor [Ramlibacter alkalitolerans]
MIRVMLVDDHAVVRMGFRMLLATAQMEVVAEAESGEQACRDYPQVQPDVLVMDISMPGMGGLEAMRRLLAHSPEARVLALSAHDAIPYAHRALTGGALGYLSKRSAPDALIEAVRAVARGERYIDAALARRMALAQVEGETNPSDVLTEREFAVFIQLAQGSTVPQIAEQLKLASSTVGTHLYNIKQKLRVANQAELTLIGLRWGLIQP